MSFVPALKIHYLFEKKSSYFGLFFCLIRGCSLSWIMQPDMFERREGWLKGEKMVRKREAETRQREVRDRSRPGKRDKHDLSGHILYPLSGTLKHWKTIGSAWVPSSGGGGDQQCMTIILAGTCFYCLLQFILANRKGLKMYVCPRWWFKSLTSFRCYESIWITESTGYQTEMQWHSQEGQNCFDGQNANIFNAAETWFETGVEVCSEWMWRWKVAWCKQRPWEDEMKTENQFSWIEKESHLQTI